MISNEVVEAARRIVAALGDDWDWKRLEGDRIEKDGYICARYILSLAPGKDVVEGALEVIGKWMALTPVALNCAKDVAAFATACVKREREECARIVEDYKKDDPEYAICAGYRLWLAAAIRVGGKL